jgi:thiosulfate/3-mercaptopyruvate sulfurtransferase
MPLDKDFFTTVIAPAEAVEHFGDPEWAFLDCRFDLSNTDWGREEYLRAHVPGALFVHLDRDLTGVPNGRNGRHPLPDFDDFKRRAGGWGIGPGVQVVVYDQEAGNFAARLWWMLRSLGHHSVAVLDGGFARWMRENHPVRSGEERRTPRQFEGRLDQSMYVTADEVDIARRDPSWKVIDARAPERFRGETEPIDPVAGCIPGAVNHFFRENLAADGTFLPPSDLRARLDTLLGNVSPSNAIVYCGSGVFSAHILVAMAHAGLPGGKLYTGSWSEWCSDPSRPVGRS